MEASVPRRQDVKAPGKPGNWGESDEGGFCLAIRIEEWEGDMRGRKC
jgi:hypothetical protein